QRLRLFHLEHGDAVSQVLRCGWSIELSGNVPVQPVRPQHLDRSHRVRSLYAVIDRQLDRLGPDGAARPREIGLFGGLSGEVLREFGGSLDVLQLGPGAIVFHEGDSGREMYVVLEGEMEILRRSKRNHEARVAILGPNDWFGEMSILDIMPRS